MEAAIRRKRVADENKQIVMLNQRLVPITCKVDNFIRCTDNQIQHEKNDIDFFNGTTNQAIRYYLNQNSRYRIAVLNMANSHQPGGGYLYGASAQEEELCRTSPFLYASIANRSTYIDLYDGWGDAWYNRVLYTDNVLFIRSDGKTNYNLLDPSKYYKCAVISAAAPDMRHMDYDAKTHGHYMKSVIRLMHDTPFIISEDREQYGMKNFVLPNILILSAWGCGAFAPSSSSEATRVTSSTYSQMVANYFCDVLRDEGSNYARICFAITTDQKNNYAIFRDTFLRRHSEFASVNVVGLG